MRDASGFCHPHSDRWPNTISTTTRRVGFSPTTCPAEIKIEATTNENKGLLYSSILGSSSVSGSFEHMSGCHIFQRPLGFGAHLIWNFGRAIMLGSHQNFRKMRLYSGRLRWPHILNFYFAKQRCRGLFREKCPGRIRLLLSRLLCSSARSFFLSSQLLRESLPPFF